MVMHVLLSAAGNQLQHLIARVIRIGDDFALPMISDQAPIADAALKIAGGDQLGCGAIGIFNHADIIKQHLTAIQQAEHAIFPLGIRTHRAGRGHRFIGVGLPGGARPFIACGPRFRHRIIRPWIAQFQTGPASIGKLRPTAAIKEMEFIHFIAVLILDRQAAI